MFKSRVIFTAKILLQALVCFILLMSANYALGDTDDDDTTLHFYWAAASGNVDHYNVYLYIDSVQHSETWATATTPSSEDPYSVPIVAEAGRMYQLRVQAEDADGATGPMSNMSDPVWCQFPRSPGNIDGSMPGDADGDLRVGVGDWQILSKADGTQRGDASFDYRADLNYDHSIDQDDFSTITSYWGNIYSGGS